MSFEVMILMYKENQVHATQRMLKENMEALRNGMQ